MLCGWCHGPAAWRMLFALAAISPSPIALCRCSLGHCPGSRLTLTGGLKFLATHLGTAVPPAWRSWAHWRPSTAPSVGRQRHGTYKQADAMAENRTLSLKEEELVSAKARAKKECAHDRSAVPAVASPGGSVDAEMASLRAVAVDPRADALQRLATLLGFEGEGQGDSASPRSLGAAAVPGAGLDPVLCSSIPTAQPPAIERLHNHCTLQSKPLHNHCRAAPGPRRKHSRT